MRRFQLDEQAAFTLEIRTLKDTILKCNETIKEVLILLASNK